MLPFFHIPNLIINLCTKLIIKVNTIGKPVSNDIIAILLLNFFWINITIPNIKLIHDNIYPQIKTIIYVYSLINEYFELGLLKSIGKITWWNVASIKQINVNTIITNEIFSNTVLFLKFKFYHLHDCTLFIFTIFYIPNLITIIFAAPIIQGNANGVQIISDIIENFLFEFFWNNVIIPNMKLIHAKNPKHTIKKFEYGLKYSKYWYIIKILELGLSNG